MCERCGRTNITSHHKCADCQRWVGDCCLASTAPTEPNWCLSCVRYK